MHRFPVAPCSSGGAEVEAIPEGVDTHINQFYFKWFNA